MKSSSTIFLAAFTAASLSWAGFVLAPQIQLGRLGQSKAHNADNPYPSARSGLAEQGAEVYRSLGCVYCHSQQVRQEGARCDIFLTDIGTNRLRVEKIVAKLNPALAKDVALKPGKISEVADVPASESLLAELRAAGAKADVRVVPSGPDIARGFGPRQSVAADYIFDAVVQPGTRRNGPDLSNAGAGKLAEWQLVHLYAPKARVPDSTMPPYPFLFQKRKISGAVSPEALKLPKSFEPEAGFEIVPTAAANALVAYLGSLRADAPLDEAPYTAPQVETAGTNSTAK